MAKRRPRLDLSRSLNQMLGYADTIDETTGLTLRYTRAMSTPAGSLDVGQIELLFGQGPSDDLCSLLVPIAVERLASNFFGWYADLLLVDVARRRSVLAEQPEVRRRAVEIVVANADALASYDGIQREQALDAALTLVEHDPAALAVLADAYARAGDRENTDQVQRRRLDAAPTAEARVAVLVDIARQLEPWNPVDSAYAWLDVLDAAPGHELASAEAERLFTLYEDWGMVARVLERRADLRSLDQAEG